MRSASALTPKRPDSDCISRSRAIDPTKPRNAIPHGVRLDLCPLPFCVDIRDFETSRSSNGQPYRIAANASTPATTAFIAPAENSTSDGAPHGVNTAMIRIGTTTVAAFQTDLRIVQLLNNS